MKVVLFGAGGRVGKVLRNELLSRGHSIRLAYHQSAPMTPPMANETSIALDISSAPDIAAAVSGQDAAINAVGPGRTKDPSIIERAASALCEGLVMGGLRRLIIVGGAGTLELRPNIMRLDDPSYPAQFRQSGETQKAALAAYRASDLDWTYISPPIMFHPGERTGQYRIGNNAVIFDKAGKSHISFEDYSMALVDEMERGTHLKQRITFAY